MKVIAASLAAVMLLLPSFSFAEHKSAVVGQVIDSDDRGIRPQDDGCVSLHYHGTLSGVADPDQHGCGHGLVTRIAHGDGDGESLPPPPAKKGLWDRFWTWVGSLNREDAKNVVDVAAEANGVAPPFTVSDAVDITKEATPSIMENVGNINEYRENVAPEEDTLGVYNDLGDVPENPTLSQRFFRWFNNLLD
mgnify:FL=1